MLCTFFEIYILILEKQISAIKTYLKIKYYSSYIKCLNEFLRLKL